MTKNHTAKERRIKVEEMGDFWHKRTCPRIRLQGKWLAEAGIPANSYVRVLNPKPGVLIFHAVEIEP